ncbi:predicted protein [Histoplasma capsulatum G186AR]|uniref:Uncharacterized protein n=1 Tax=Ajellomyces capsulatus (strain G186AR / H82 / ATCC MYA-2454 / RMSCC 2432) TaxID=447093 RepID=C0NN34_AJECG|nr:uncharacterized protein HCBG_04161 [Histoplasma capsulatum G186AR]EEH07282.1 predicted protein [Histoplasma capsulatum G186AR]
MTSTGIREKTDIKTDDSRRRGRAAEEGGRAHWGGESRSGRGLGVPGQPMAVGRYLSPQLALTSVGEPPRTGTAADGECPAPIEGLPRITTLMETVPFKAAIFFACLILTYGSVLWGQSIP